MSELMLTGYWKVTSTQAISVNVRDSAQLPTKIKVEHDRKALRPYFRTSMNILRGFRSPMWSVHRQLDCRPQRMIILLRNYAPHQWKAQGTIPSNGQGPVHFHKERLFVQSFGDSSD